MYLVLKEHNYPSSVRSMYAFVTNDQTQVAESLKEGAIIYKLDSLPRVYDIEVSYNEILTEDKNG